MFFTYANHNNKKNIAGFTTEIIEFSDIPKFVTSNSYCSNSLVGGSRATNIDKSLPSGIEKYNGKEDVLIIDIDENLFIEQAIELFKAYKFYLITTQSHRKMKGGKLQGDRFRMFILLDETIDDYEYRILFTRWIYSTYSFIDQSCKNHNRLFYASPQDARVIFNDGIAMKMPIPIIAEEISSASVMPAKPITVLTNQSTRTVSWNGLQLEVLENIEEEETTHEGGNGLDEEAKLRGKEKYLSEHYYAGNKSICLFNVACMMKKDGFSEDFTTDYLINYWNSKATSTDKMSSALQNIRGAFKLN